MLPQRGAGRAGHHAGAAGVSFVPHQPHILFGGQFQRKLLCVLMGTAHGARQLAQCGRRFKQFQAGQQKPRFCGNLAVKAVAQCLQPVTICQQGAKQQVFRPVGRQPRGLPALFPFVHVRLSFM